MNLDFTELLSVLNNEFGQNIGMCLHYYRSDVTNSKIQILMQQYLDTLCVEELEFIVVDDGVKIRSFKYHDKMGDGKMSHPYQVVLKDKSEPLTLKNISDINVNLW